MLRMKIKQGVIVAENLKKRIRETTNTNSGLTPPNSTCLSSPSPSIIPHDDCKLKNKFYYFEILFFFLFVVVDLNNDKVLFDAYQHCLNGNQLVRNIFQEQTNYSFFLNR